ncbi:MAG: tetratricopeptide repeat protein [Acidobacteria bacterium]|nr:tetratricopeptide repeat protein [Acidobacteriota bacterium]
MWPLVLILSFLLQPDSKLIQTHIQEALSALQRNEPAAAERSLLAAIQLQPDTASLWFLLAQAQARQNNMKGALLSADKAARFAGKDPSLLYNLALFNLEAGRVDISLSIGNQALAIEDSADVRDLLGRAYEAKQDWKQAIPQYAQARRLAPYSEQAIFRLAQAQMQAQDFPAAISTLEDGRKTFDKSPQLELALGVAYYGQRRFPDAVDRFLRVMQLAPDIPQPYYFIGRVLEHAADRIPEVLSRAAQFEKAHPQSPLGFVLHARALLLRPSPEDPAADDALAESLLKKALIIKEDQADTHLLLGMVFERQKNMEGAAAEFKRSTVLNPTDPVPHFRLARIYDRLGRKEEALRERALHEKLSHESGAAPKPDLKGLAR